MDPKAGKRYVETIQGGMVSKGVDDLYKLTAHDDDYVNPTTEGVLSWRGISACSLDSDDELDNWKHRLHEVSARRCAHITKTLRWIRSKIYELSMFDGEGSMETFFVKYEEVLGEP